MSKYVLRIGSAVLAMAAGLAAGQVSAEEAEAAASDGEILVTAQKRAQALIEVPQSVTVVGGETLEDQHADSFQDYLKLVPGLQLDQSRAGQGRLILRGVNTDGVASTIGVYMDETPFGSSSGLVNGAVLAGDFDTFDLDRIEVLRGPQGTIYGASSLSGVLKFVTAAPSTAALEVRGRVGAEATRHGEASGYGNLVVNVPISEMAAFRASGFYRSIGGYVDSIGTGGSDVEENINDSKSYGGRASLLVMPSDGIDLRLTAVLQDIKADAPSLVESDPDTLDVLYGDYTQSQFVPGFSDLSYRVYNATGDFDLGFGTLTSSTSYGTQKQDLRTDYHALSPLIEAIFGVPNEFFQDQSTDSEKFTQELRLAGETAAADWLVGLFYTEEDGLIEQDFIASEPDTTTPIAGLPLLGYARVDSKYREIAGFANLTWHVTDRFDLDLGGRYSDNKQEATQVTDGVLVGGVRTELPVTESSEDVFTFSVAPRFEISDNASLYARVASGYRPGGPNVLPPGASPEIASYDSDSLVNYEIGLKMETPDNVLGLEVAVFHIDWEDIQLLATDGTFNFNANGGGAKSDGVEFTATLDPAPGLNFSANAAYTDARLTTDTLIGGLDGDKLPFTPEFAASLNGDYSFPVGGEVEAHVGGSVRYVSEQMSSFDTTSPQREIDDYAVVDLSAGVDFGRFDLELYVKNLTDSSGRTSTTGTTVFGAFPLFPNGAIGTGVIRPRTVGLSLRAEL